MSTLMLASPSNPLAIQELKDRMKAHSVDLKLMKDEHKNTIGRAWAVLLVIMAAILSAVASRYIPVLPSQQQPPPQVTMSN